MYKSIWKLYLLSMILRCTAKLKVTNLLKSKSSTWILYPRQEKTNREHNHMLHLKYSRSLEKYKRNSSLLEFSLSKLIMRSTLIKSFFACDFVDLPWLGITHLYRLARPYWSRQQLHYSLITSAHNVMYCIRQQQVCCAACARKLHRYAMHVSN